MAILIKSSGVSTEVKPDGKKFTLEQLRGFVGGYIEVVPVGNGECVVCDEEGKLKGKPLNMAATAMFRRLFDPFVGDVLICKRKEL